MAEQLQDTDLLRGANLYLIGMMGAGKSTLGREMARRLGYRFLDTDELIEQAAGCSIPDIFANAGEAQFRDLETQILAQLSPHTRLVIATGGGIVLRRKNWSHLHHGVVTWLDVPLVELQQRLQGKADRPLLQRPDWKQHLAQLLEQRRPLYAEADIQLTVAIGDKPASTADRLLKQLRERILPPRGQTPEASEA